ncbi:nicotinamidase [Desulfopila sp. IMCC35008]|uniref:nicotinamidase n=1 Tax=Desulfopila sp. IMCC35008 TaxID=2653858 RepID=UPI0013D6F928|nr:nicotinamidase [Desulfopila sp. IMCC35008]
MKISLYDNDALLIVDVQNDFLPGGNLGVPEGDQIVPVINSYISLFTNAKLHVFASRDYHPADHCSFAEQGGSWPSHCVAGTRGADFAAGLNLPEDVSIISKATEQDRDAYSALEATGLNNELKQQQVKRVFVCGLATDYCVLASVRGLLQADFEVILLVDAIKGVNLTPGDSDKAIKEMLAKGAVKLTLEELEK